MRKWAGIFAIGSFVFLGASVEAAALPVPAPLAEAPRV